MPVVPNDFVGVMPHARHGKGGQGRLGSKVGGAKNAKWVGWHGPFISATGARAVGTEVFPAVNAAMPVAPINEQTVLGISSQGDRGRML